MSDNKTLEVARNIEEMVNEIEKGVESRISKEFSYGDYKIIIYAYDYQDKFEIKVINESGEKILRIKFNTLCNDYIILAERIIDVIKNTK